MEKRSMTMIFRVFVLLCTGLAMVACTKTDMSGSWTDTNFKGPVKKVYIVGIGKNEMNRRVFEDSFSNYLFSKGVSTEASYRDIMTSQEVNKEILAEKMAKKGCDAVLLTRLIGQRQKTEVSPERSFGYYPGPFYGGYGSYARPAHYANWGSYYGYPYNVVYEPSITTEYVVLTIESVMYDLKTEQLIWSAQYEKVIEGSLDTMVQDYVERVAKDLKGKGLI